MARVRFLRRVHRQAPDHVYPELFERSFVHHAFTVPPGRRWSTGASGVLEQRDRRCEPVQEVLSRHRPDFSGGEATRGGQLTYELRDDADVVMRGVEHTCPSAVASEDERALRCLTLEQKA